MNSRVLFLVIGLVLGAIVGYVTRPEAAELKIGPFSVEVQGNHPASSSDTGSLTTGQLQHIGVYTVAGGALGALAGFLAGGRRSRS
ncbi:MAG: hypothetical protein WBC24_08050 [Methylovirgula sp.]|jgi:hypothetical protein